MCGWPWGVFTRGLEKLVDFEEPAQPSAVLAARHLGPGLAALGDAEPAHQLRLAWVRKSDGWRIGILGHADGAPHAQLETVPQDHG